MTTSADSIVQKWADRKKRLDPQHATMRMFEEFINDRLPVPLAELDRNEQSAVANLATQGLGELARRTGSVVPIPEWPPLRPGFKEHEQRARDRKRVNLGWWERNDMQAVLTLRAEYLLGHTMAPVLVKPDEATGVPTWRVLDPLTVFPAPCADPLDIVPCDTIVAFRQTFGWLKAFYGDMAFRICRPKDARDDWTFTYLQYIDGEEIVCLAVSDKDRGNGYDILGVDKIIELERQPNLAETPLVFIPSVYGLGGPRSKFAGTQGIHIMRAKILALAYITASKGANPDLYLEPLSAGQTEEPEILREFDPRTGQPGIIADGRLVPVTINPSTASIQMLSILERELRSAGGIPAAFGGEAATTVQTGRLAANLTASAVDFTIQQTQQRLERSLALEDIAAAKIARKWTPGKRSFYVSWRGARGMVDYDPAELFEADYHAVRYPLSGSDLNNELLRSQQKVATGMWSKKTALEMDPETLDADMEHDRVIAEKLEEALLGLVLAKAQDPASGWTEIEFAKLRQIVMTNEMELDDAVIQINEDVQKAQAAKAAAAAPPAPGTPEAAAAQPGLAVPPQAIPQGPPSLENLRNTLRQVATRPPVAA